MYGVLKLTIFRLVSSSPYPSSEKDIVPERGSSKLISVAPHKGYLSFSVIVVFGCFVLSKTIRSSSFSVVTLIHRFPYVIPSPSTYRHMEDTSKIYSLRLSLPSSPTSNTFPQKTESNSSVTSSITLRNLTVIESPVPVLSADAPKNVPYPPCAFQRGSRCKNSPVAPRST